MSTAGGVRHRLERLTHATPRVPTGKISAADNPYAEPSAARSPPRAAMSSSDSDGDAHHRIPHGASDEEIDSDCASGYDSDSAPAAARAAAPKYGDDGLLISAAGNGSGVRASRDDISKAARLLWLRGEAPLPADGLELPSSDDDEDGNIDDCEVSGGTDAENCGEVGDDVLAAATGRRDFAERARRRREAVRSRAEAREVVPGNGEEGALRAGVRAEGSGGGGGYAAVLRRMVDVLEGERGGMGNLKKKLERVSGAAGKALDAPLPAVVAGRVGRAVAYGKTVEEVGKWAGVVRKHRNEKQLVFPLNDPGGARSMGTREVGERFTPGNEFEKEVDCLLRAAGVVTEEGVIRVEEEALAEAAGRVSKEDLIARRRELARMRSAVFENDRKLRRIKKIKSRKFRKVMKMEKARVAEEARAAGLGSDDEVDDVLRVERDRAEERMTLRHKNTSKWVKRQLQRGEVKRNVNAREAVEEQLRIGEELRRKMASSDILDGRGGAGDGSENGSGSDGDGENGAEELAALRDDLVRGGANVCKKRGLMGLKFMQDAQERRRNEAIGLLEEMEGAVDGSGGSDDEIADTSLALSVGQGRAGAGSVGRRVFSGQLALSKGGMPVVRGEDGAVNENEIREQADGVLGNETEASNSEALVLEIRLRDEYSRAPAGMAAVLGRKGSKALSATEAFALPTNGDKSHEATRGGGFTTTLEGRIEVHVSGGQSAPTRGPPRVSYGRQTANDATKTLADNPWLKPVSAKWNRSIKHTAGIVEELVVSLPTESLQGNRPSKKVKFDTAKQTVQPKAVDNVSDCQVARERASASTGAATGSPGATSYPDEQMSRMLIASKAFAGAGGADLADFEAAKQAEIVRSLPTAKDVGAIILPGWGGWAGAGNSEGRHENGKGISGPQNGSAEETPFAKAARKKLEAARAQALVGRADGRLSHVLVSARRAKKAADLTMASVPFPYASAEQWELEVAAPLVRERLTASSHSIAMKPRIVAPRGEALQPLRMSIAQTADRKKADKSGAIRRRGKRAQQRDGKRRSLMG